MPGPAYSSNQQEQIENFVCSQGWNDGGDLSWIFYSNRNMGIPADQLPDNLANINEARGLLWDNSRRARNAFTKIFHSGGISTGDIIILYLGNTVRYIGEIPISFLYYFDPNLGFGNCIFPIKYYDITAVFGQINEVIGAGKGIPGIQNYGGGDQNAKNYIIDEWKNYKSQHNIVCVFPQTQQIKYDQRSAGLTNKITESKDAILKFLAEEKIKPMRDLLLANKQLILTGAPGTGKTYTAKQLVHREILGRVLNTQPLFDEEKELKVRSEFIQFHQNYDYTDFVEGLKPTTIGAESDSKNIGFELRNGIFKEFCRRAGLPERIKAEGQDINDDATIHKFLANDKDGENFWKNWRDDNELDSLDNITDLPKFYFIIDEINRSDLSRVFGELFYSLEPDYRGIKGKVKTQYSSLNNDKTFFINSGDDHFFIPSNVYIIGTMNDIDRSVESFDFALRRRFAWYEIKADDTCFDQVMDGILDDQLKTLARNRYKNLNSEIANTHGLDESYQIGPAYFRKLVHYTSDPAPFDKLWKNHLLLLIKEYLRGMTDSNKKTDDLKKAYDKSN